MRPKTLGGGSARGIGEGMEDESEAEGGTPYQVTMTFMPEGSVAVSELAPVAGGGEIDVEGEEGAAEEDYGKMFSNADKAIRYVMQQLENMDDDDEGAMEEGFGEPYPESQLSKKSKVMHG